MTPDHAAADTEGLSHLALLYRNQAEYLARIPAFARGGLARGEPVLIAVPEPNADLLREQLSGTPGDLTYTEMTELGRNPARLIPVLQDFIDAHPGQRVRYVSEPIWPGRSAEETCEATRHEALINLAFSRTAATILCPYDAAGLAPSVISGVQSTHPAVLENGSRRTKTAYAGPGRLPPGCERPLPAPPPHAESLDYSDNLRPIRHLVAGYARQTGLDEDRTADLVLAAGEIAANTLGHTPGGGTIHVWHTGSEILCQLHDKGQITDPLAGRRHRPPEGHGHGLWVVNQICDLVELRTGEAGTTIRLHIRLPQP
jgi:anti-sigma regulatory factor (Ser/Thr protein kinase)